MRTNSYLFNMKKTNTSSRSASSSSSQDIQRAELYLQDDVIEADQVLRPGAPLAVVGPRLLQLNLQGVSHALVPLHQRAQLDVGQIAAAEKPNSRSNLKGSHIYVEPTSLSFILSLLLSSVETFSRLVYQNHKA